MLTDCGNLYYFVLCTIRATCISSLHLHLARLTELKEMSVATGVTGHPDDRDRLCLAIGSLPQRILGTPTLANSSVPTLFGAYP
jgi:hypothetical protein